MVSVSSKCRFYQFFKVHNIVQSICWFLFHFILAFFFLFVLVIFGKPTAVTLLYDTFQTELFTVHAFSCNIKKRKKYRIFFALLFNAVAFVYLWWFVESKFELNKWQNCVCSTSLWHSLKKKRAHAHPPSHTIIYMVIFIVCAVVSSPASLYIIFTSTHFFIIFLILCCWLPRFECMQKWRQVTLVK